MAADLTEAESHSGALQYLSSPGGKGLIGTFGPRKGGGGIVVLDRSREEIARDLTEQAEKTWGPERAAALREEIDKVADWISLIAPEKADLEGDEPDFLVAPASEREGQ